MATASDLISQLMGGLSGGQGGMMNNGPGMGMVRPPMGMPPQAAAGQIPVPGPMGGGMRFDQSSGWIPNTPGGQISPVVSPMGAMMPQGQQGPSANLGGGLPAGQQFGNLSNLLNQYHNAGMGLPSSGQPQVGQPSTGGIDFASLLNNPNLAAILQALPPGGLMGGGGGAPPAPAPPQAAAANSQFDRSVPHPGMRYDDSSGWIY